MSNLNKSIPALAKKAGLGAFTVFAYIATVATAVAVFGLAKTGNLPDLNDTDQIIGLIIAGAFAYAAIGFYVWRIFSK